MELEDQKKIETCLEIIILTESDLIREKYAKIRQDEQSEHRKNDLEKNYKKAVSQNSPREKTSNLEAKRA